MKKILIILIALIIIPSAYWLFASDTSQKNYPVNQQNIPDVSSLSSPPSENKIANPANQTPQLTDFQPPLDRPSERVTKKHFGQYITPQNSPVQPERFQGYHSGTDFEIFSDELNQDVTVHAVCSGNLILKEYASGYGGVAVESCNLDNQPITVIYGHLRLASVTNNKTLTVGDTIGLLGNNKSTETDGERKHLHLGFHKGSAINIRGYVNNKNDLSQWLDPCEFVCK